MNDLSTDASPMVEAHALAFSRRDEPILRPLDFHLAAGELSFVEGDNGSGKTTLLNILAGLLRPSSGEVRISGYEPGSEGARAETRLLGHQLGLKGDLSARENLRVSIGLYGCRKGATVDQSLAEVGLRGFEDEPIRSLSAGQKKRVALAALNLGSARLWLLDEPFANLDRAGIDLVNAMLDQHLQRGGAALVTTHEAVSFRQEHTRKLRLNI